jgi:hypothetical protein
VSQCRMVIARRLSGVVAISCIRILRRLLQSLLLLRNDITTQPRRPVSSYFMYLLDSGARTLQGIHLNDEKGIMQSSLFFVDKNFLRGNTVEFLFFECYRR